MLINGLLGRFILLMPIISIVKTPKELLEGIGAVGVFRAAIDEPTPSGVFGIILLPMILMMAFGALTGYLRR